MIKQNNIPGKQTTGAGPDAEDPFYFCHHITEHSPVPLVAVEGQTHRVRYVNPAFCRLCGKAREELIGYPFAEAVPEGEENGCRSLLDQVYRTGEANTLMDQIHAPSASSGAYWSYSAWKVLDAHEHLVGLMVQITDTSEARYIREQIDALNQALHNFGIEQHELTDVLHTRQKTVEVNEALLTSVLHQNELVNDLNVRLQRAMTETHHRVKNNLQVISALAELQIDHRNTVVPTSALQRITFHIHTLANLHDILTQQSRTNSQSDMLDTQVVLTGILQLLQMSIGSRCLHYEIASIMLPLSKNASLSLLVNELVSNAFKHGEGDITVTLERTDREVHLIVCDHGKGFPVDFGSLKADHTGLDLSIEMARLDLQGAIDFTNLPEGGACVVVTFPI